MSYEDNVLIQKILQNLYAAEKASPGAELDDKGLAEACGIEDPYDVHLRVCIKKLNDDGFINATTFFIKATFPVDRVAKITEEGIKLVEDQEQLNFHYPIR